MTWQVWSMDCPNNNIIKHGRNVRWAAAARILKNPASARWCRRAQNQEALELDAGTE